MHHENSLAWSVLVVVGQEPEVIGDVNWIYTFSAGDANGFLLDRGIRIISRVILI